MTDLSNLFKPLEENIDEPTCAGLVFRADENIFLGKDKSINTNLKLRLLKRKSCSGCPTCEYIFEELEEVSLEGINLLDFKPFVNGKLYTIDLVGGGESFNGEFMEYDGPEFTIIPFKDKNEN